VPDDARAETNQTPHVNDERATSFETFVLNLGDGLAPGITPPPPPGEITMPRNSLPMSDGARGIVTPVTCRPASYA
jgi:hypothetical protein